jgi:hypothetical protein
MTEPPKLQLERHCNTTKCDRMATCEYRWANRVNIEVHLAAFLRPRRQLGHTNTNTNINTPPPSRP